MGDINFNVFKDVNLNKQVTLDIDKNVNVNVNNNDILATAEADAEAFGSNALAEVDVLTLATETEAFAYAESTSALDLQDPIIPIEGITIFTEGTLGEGANVLSGGSFAGAFTEDPFPPTGSGTVEEFNLTFFDNTGAVFTVSECNQTCGGGLHSRITLPDGTTIETWDYTLNLNLDMDTETIETLEFIFTGTPGSNEFDFVEGQLTTEENLGEPLQITDMDFAAFPPSSIGDRVWLDDNMNGLQDDGEGGVPDITVRLLREGSELRNTTTDQDGLYLFKNLGPGTYQVEFDISDTPLFFTDPKQGEDDTVDSDAFPIVPGSIGRTDPIILAEDVNNLDIDAGLEFGFVLPSADIGDRVWFDTNTNGLQDDGEPGEPDITVRLLDSNDGTVLRETVTNAEGLYLFDDVAVGTYVVEFDISDTPLFFTDPKQGEDDTVDSDAFPIVPGSIGRTDPIILAEDVDNLDIDAGLVLGLNIGLVQPSAA